MRWIFGEMDVGFNIIAARRQVGRDQYGYITSGVPIVGIGQSGSN